LTEIENRQMFRLHDLARELLQRQIPQMLMTDNTNKLREYSPLQTSTFSNPFVIRDYDPLYYKLNIMACSGRILYIAIHKKIYCYNLVTLFLHMNQPTLDRKPFAKIDNEHEVHHIRAAKLMSGDDVLIAVGENGQVKLILPQQDKQNPFRTLTLNKDLESTWSVSFSTQLNTVIIGSNGRFLTCIPLVADLAHNKLEGHTHNIPCVDISSNGEFAVSGSIDTTIRVWHLPTQKCICSWHQGREGEWVWGVRWFPKRFVKVVKDDEKILTTDSLRSNRVVLGNRDSDHMSVDRIFDEEEEADQEIQIQESETEEENVEDHSSEHASTKEKQKPEIRVPNDELIIVASKHHLYLLDSNMQELDRKYVNPARIAHLIPVFFRHISRLSLIEVIPELSLLLVASQSDCKLIMIRIVRNESGTTYKLVPEKALPEYPNVYPIAGLSVEKVSSNDCSVLPQYHVYMLCVDKTLHSFSISAKRGKDGELKPLDVTSVLL
jgi:hypothetical protein